MAFLGACCCTEGVNEPPEAVGARMLGAYHESGGDPDEPVAQGGKDRPRSGPGERVLGGGAGVSEEAGAPQKADSGRGPSSQDLGSMPLELTPLRNHDDEFLVVLELTGERIGVEIAHGKGKDEGLVRIKSVKSSGLVAEWNTMHPTARVEPSHYILEMNGKEVSKMSLEEVRNAFTETEKLTLLMKRSKPFR